MSLHFLVDGFNLLYALPEMPTGTWEQKRQALLDWLHTHHPQGHNQLTVVFDSRQGSGDRMKTVDGEVVYTAGETADDWIAAKVRQVSNPRILVIVTNDRGLQTQVRGTGAKVMSCDAFIQSGQKSKTPPRPSPREDLNDITEELKKKWLE